MTLFAQSVSLKDIEKRIGEGSEVVVFEGRGHGFAHNPSSPEEDEDAEKAFTVMRNWLHERQNLPEQYGGDRTFDVANDFLALTLALYKVLCTS
ncbi:hypothetical protein OIU85_004445 [Salix viminalis]|uniref:Uncharacterized protein n=1 Tax=Salix viminalis TaxID=40686 RepID=A0A9Q0PT93_SALVM|nr:hypothetical protein OIU85_004445 [Salix viminalis]